MAVDSEVCSINKSIESSNHSCTCRKGVDCNLSAHEQVAPVAGGNLAVYMETAAFKNHFKGRLKCLFPVNGRLK